MSLISSIKHIKRCWCLLCHIRLLLLLLVVIKALILIVKAKSIVILLLLLVLLWPLLLISKITLCHLLLCELVLLIVSLIVALVIIGLELILLLILLAKWILSVEILVYHSCAELLLLWDRKSTICIHCKTWIWNKSFWLFRFCWLLLSLVCIEIKWIIIFSLWLILSICICCISEGSSSIIVVEKVKGVFVFVWISCWFWLRSSVHVKTTQ